MDPVTILTIVATVAKSTFSPSKTLYIFLTDTAVLDDTFKLFCLEIADLATP